MKQSNNPIIPNFLLTVFISIICLSVIAPESVLSQEENNPVRFAVIGDYGDSTMPFLGLVAEMINDWEPDFIVTTGDNNYMDNTAETMDINVGQFFHEFIFPYYGDYGRSANDNRFFPSLGNHDKRDEDGSIQPYLDFFTLPGNERYYDFVWGPIHFFILNSNEEEPDGITDDSVQADWLEEVLSESIAPWQFVILHHAPYSSGWHGDNTDTQWPFKQWGTDAVLAAHDHHYERIIVDDLLYFVNGIGGDNLRAIEDVTGGSRVRYNASHGAMLVTADADEVRFEFHGLRGMPLATVTSVTIEEWSEFDLSSIVTDEGIYNFGLATASTSEIIFNSSENDNNHPELVIQTSEGEFTFYATDDAYVEKGNSDENFGEERYLELRQREWQDFDVYLRFDVSELRGDIQSATLRLFARDGEAAGGIGVYAVSDTLNDGETEWTEDNITAETAPAIQGVNEPIDVFTLIHE